MIHDKQIKLFRGTVAVLCLCQAGFSQPASQQDPTRLQNWLAPLYWQPPTSDDSKCRCDDEVGQSRLGDP